MKVLFIVPYPAGTAPSQRFRFEHYLETLIPHGITYSMESFLDLSAWNIIYKRGHQWKKITGVLRGFMRRFRTLFRLSKYDYVFIHREATPLGPAWFEWATAKLFHKRIIYDFDDAIWIPGVSANNRGIKSFRNFGKVKNICRWADKVVTGNAFLAGYAAKYNKDVRVIPTVVDTAKVHNRMQEQHTVFPAVGWTGSFSTLKYLNILIPVLQELQGKLDFIFMVIADKDPKLPLKNYRFIPWHLESEVEDLLNFHIGLMPLSDDDLSRGKCGFKAIQYMSLGIPAVVSPIGVNTVIVDDGVNGFHCDTADHWKKSLEVLVKDPLLRTDMGKAARDKIINDYSVSATTNKFLELFR